jgi:hypothetical protein
MSKTNASGFLVVYFALCTACSSSERPGPAAQGGSGGDAPDAAPAAGGKGTGGNTAGTGSGPSTGGASNDPDLGIFFTQTSTERAFTDGLGATHEPSVATIQASGGVTALKISMTASGAIGPGTFDCASGTASVMWQEPLGLIMADQTHGSCSITATSIAAAPGEITEGTFTATLPIPRLTPPIEMSAGRFKIRMQ